MRNLIFIYAALFCTGLWADSGQVLWRRADLRDKVRLLNQYKEFFQDWHEQHAGDLSQFTTTSSRSFFISEAWASEMNCIYAGWPSQRVNNLCSSPLKQNPSYQQGVCGANQMQCQPLLFGKGQCVSVASQRERNLAFTNCDKKFLSSNKKVSEIVNEIIQEGKENELFELMSFADNICKTGAQASTGMCQRLKNAIGRMKENLPPDAQMTTNKPQVRKESPTLVIEENKETILKTVEKVTNVLSEDRTPLPQLDICPPEENGTPFTRSAPREGQIDYVTSKAGQDPSWENVYKGFVGEQELRPNGFRMRNIGPNDVADGAPIDPSQRVERSWHFASDDNSRRETYLWVTDDSGSGYLSQLMESVILIIPRKVVPAVEVIGEDLHVTLTTGEKVVYDKKTRVIKSGVLNEGKVDLNPDRFKRKFAPIKYSGSGISIRVDKRGEDPRLITGNATVTQNGKTCQVPAKELWSAKAQFKYSDDGPLVNYLNTKCGKKFSI